MHFLNTVDLLNDASAQIKNDFEKQNFILSYQEYLDVFVKNPKKLTRNAAEYMLDMFDYFGVENCSSSKKHFKLFDRSREKGRAKIIGQDDAHNMIYSVLEQFVRQGRIDKLMLLHGPNGSSKSSTAEAIAHALEEYSKTPEGAVYRFNWVFPSDKIGYDGLEDVAGKKQIGFGKTNQHNNISSFAHLVDEEITCKISSEMKENPIFILPKSQRLELYGKIYSQDGNIPSALEQGSLSAKNKKIFDSLLLAYKGDLEKVIRHVQVERFFYSSRYRIGIATVEPQMAIDAQEKQISIEKNLQNIPPVLQNIRLFEPQGELVDANRGFIEFSDILKRPLEAFKYLVTTIERMSINLASGTADLDMIMIASANEKHLDAFKNTPDWPSFKGRFELIRVPYLLSAKLEKLIYEEDVHTIEKIKKMGPHALSLLCRWAVLTRLRRPDFEAYPDHMKDLMERLEPYDKLDLYDGKALSVAYSEQEKNNLKEQLAFIQKESQSTMAYEGRFGASPREIKMILYFASQNKDFDCVSSLAIFNEIEKFIQDRTVYDFLQFEPQDLYHNVQEFLTHIKDEYAAQFHKEFLSALNLYNEDQYVSALRKYMQYVTALLKKERILNEVTGAMEHPTESQMSDIEKLMDAPNEKTEFREKLIAKAASWRVENKESEVMNFSAIFALELKTIAKNIYNSKLEEIKKVQLGMKMAESDDYQKLNKSTLDLCESTFKNLQDKFHYTRDNSRKSLIFLEKIQNSKKFQI